ncbi:MAG: Pr6Pr family membrane protein [Chitinophagaceae bacterium]
MQVPQSVSTKISMAAIAAIGWFGIIFQYYIATATPANFFSFFTIESNLLIAASFTILLIAPHTSAGRFFATATFQSALALYIVVVGLVYNTVLRGLSHLEGMSLLVDTILHVITPAAYYLYWLVFIPKGSLVWKDAMSWLWFPVAYLVYSMVRGPIVGWYPYPFLHAEKLGYPTVMVNILAMILVFFIGSLILIAIKRKPGIK